MLRSLTELLVNHLVEMVMFSVGLRARPGQVLAQLRAPNLLLREFLVIAVGIPLLTLVVIRVLPIPRFTAIVAVLVGISPTAPFLLRSFRHREAAADKALAVVAVALATSPLIVPFWLAMVNRFSSLGLRFSIDAIFRMLVLKAFAPLLIGMIVGRTIPRAGRVLDRVLVIPVTIAVCVTVVLLFYLGAAPLRLLTPPLVLALLLLSAGSALLGELAGGRDPELREILGRVAVNGNPAIALAIIGTSFPDAELGGLVAAYLICRAVAVAPYILLTKHRLSRRRRHLPA